MFLSPSGNGKGSTEKDCVSAIVCRADVSNKTGFYDHRYLFKDQHPLRRHGVHFTKQDESIFASKTELVKKALN